MLNLSDIRGAVARGYCTTENQHKVVDVDLCEAISVEIKKLVDANYYTTKKTECTDPPRRVSDR